MTTAMIQWGPEELKELKRLYAKTLKDKKDTFEFKGHLVFVGYAKYLIEYLKLHIKEG